MTEKFNMTKGTVVALVPSSSSTKVYEIRKFEKGAWACSCPAYRFTRGEVGHKFPCRHLRSLFNDFRKDAVPASTVILRRDLL